MSRNLVQNAFRIGPVRHRGKTRSFERLEDRQLLTVDPITFADPQLYGATPNGESNLPSMTADGQLVVFQSTADDLVSNDFNGQSDIFLYNRATGDVSLISVNADGTASGGELPIGAKGSSNPVISRDGRFVAFESGADDLVEGFQPGFGGQTGIFVRDLQTQTTILVSANRDNASQGANSNSQNALLSRDGQTIVFLSNATDLVSGIEGTRNQLYAWDFDTQQSELLSVNKDGTAPGNGSSNFNNRRQYSVSADGSFVAFRSNSSDLVDIDNNGIDQVYLRDRESRTTQMVSVDFLGGIGGNGHSEVTTQAISDDGRFVTFYGGDLNVVDLPFNAGPRAFVRDMQEGVTSVVSINGDGTLGSHGSMPVISADGSRIAFHSSSNILIPNELNNFGHDVFVRDMTTNETILVTENVQGTGSAGNVRNVLMSIPPTISPDGRYVAFYSEGDDLVGETDDNQQFDVFVRDLQTSTTRLASASLHDGSTGESSSHSSANAIFHVGIGLSDDGRYVAFDGTVSDLVGDDNNRRSDVFVRDLHAELTQLASPLDSSFPQSRLGNFGGHLRSISDDGRYVAFTANQGNVLLGSDITIDEPIPFPQLSAFVHDRQTNTTILASKGEGDGPNCLHGANPNLSADGRFMAFASVCSLDGNFPVMPGGNLTDVFVRDLLLGQTEQISVSADGTAVGNSHSGSLIDGSPQLLQISADGRYVAFISQATNLVDGVTITGNGSNLFFHDRQTGITRLVNAAADGGTNSTGFFPAILGFSKDGSRLLFQYQATGEPMVAGSEDTNNARDIYVYDLEGPQAFQVRLVSANVDGNAANANSGFDAISATISDDGRYVAFSSAANDIVPQAEANHHNQIYVRDVDAGTTQLVSVDTSGTIEANNASRNAMISGDGRRVIFENVFGSNLTNLGGNAFAQLYLRDLDSQTTELLTVNMDGTGPANNHSGNLDNNFHASPTWSSNGRYLAYESRATDLLSDHNPIEQPFNTTRDFYLRDFETDTTSIINYTNSGTFSTGEGAATTPGRVARFVTDSGEVFFGSNSNNLIHKDRNQATDIFVYTYDGTASISGTVFNDADEDGTRDGNENGLAYWTVYVDENLNRRFDDGERNVQTDAEGNYRFTGLPADNYSIRLRMQSGYGLTTVGSYDVELSAAEASAGKHFGVAEPDVDLVMRTVSAPVQGNPGSTIDVSFTVINTGADIAGSWQDAIYLSPTRTLTSESILLHTLAHSGGLNSGRSYSVNASAPLPAVAAGNYFVIAETDRRLQVSNDTARSNNTAASVSPINIEIPSLTLGQPTASGFSFVGQEVYFQVQVEAGETMQIELDSSAASGGIELYARFAQLPTAYGFDHGAREFGMPDQSLTVPSTRPGTYFILAKSRFGEAAAATFNITTSVAGLEADTVSPARASNTGLVTFKILGSGFKSTTVPTLRFGQQVLNADSIDLSDAATMYARFNLTGQPAGDYTLRMTDGSEVDSLVNAVSVQTIENADPLQLFLTTPEVVRFGRPAKVLVEYENTGSTDISAPLLRLEAEGATLKLPAQNRFQEGELTFLGIATDGPAGILRPGERGRVEIEFLSNGTLNQTVNFQLHSTIKEESVNWQSHKESLRPAYISPEAWEPVFGNLLDELGNSAGDYEALLASNASYLSDFGIYTSDTSRLLQLSIADANSTLVTDFLARVVDSSVRSLGMELTFTRQHQQTIDGRYSTGPFGRGWTFSWDITATSLANDVVVVQFGAHRRYFNLLADGTYGVAAGANSNLAVDGGAFTLREMDGTATRFRVDGRLDYREAPNGQRITATYDGQGRLTGLLHSNGERITLDYGSAGFVVKMTASTGNEVRYEYAADHLVAYVDRFGRHTYDYVTGQGAAREHALQSINYSDDTHLFFDYDDRGRLISENRDGGEHRIDYVYPNAGEIHRIAANSATTQLFFDDLGNLVREIEPSGNAIDYQYDHQRHLTHVEVANGISYENTYDDVGNLIQTVDPQGNQLYFTYDSHGNLSSFKDSLGRSTTFTFDSANNPTGTRYTDGIGETFTYDSTGYLLSSTDARGNRTRYETDPSGAITSKTLADGSLVRYEYDRSGRLTKAIDGSGPIVFSYADTDALEKVSYPNGTFLEFDHNVVGQRTRSVDQDGFVVNYQYDDLGRLDLLTSASNGLFVDYTYDATGNIIRKDHGNGSFSTFDYDQAGRVMEISHHQPNGIVNSSYEYTYDLLGRRSTMTFADSDPATQDGQTSYEYDTIGQLIAATSPDGSRVTYQYDAAGNRTNVTQIGATITYQSNSRNEYERVGDVRFTFDDAGNVRARIDADGTTTFTYDVENRLVGVSGPGTDVSYDYNALGQRQSKTVNGQTTNYLLDPIGLMSVHAEYNASGTLAHYIYGSGLIGRVDAEGTAAFYDFDANANTIGLTNAAGEYANRYSYLPFGETLTMSETVENPYRFVGEAGVRVDESGLVNMGFRNYDPASGRFLEQDPAGLIAGDANLRRYVSNDPVNQVDPSGLDPTPPTNDPCSIYQGIFYWTCKWWGWPSPNPWTPIPIMTSSAAGAGTAVGDPGNAGGGAGGGNSCGNDPGPPGPDLPNGPGPSRPTRTVGGFDPNDIIGPAGVGDGHHLLPNQTLAYTVRFENLKAATAPAQEVLVTHPLDEDLNLATFELDQIGFADVVVDVPPGLQSFATSIDYQNIDGSPLRVDLSAELDVESRTVVWTFLSVDPYTGSWPRGVFDGFLPPNTDPPMGEGFLSYTIRPNDDLSSGTLLEPSASIVFDFNDPIETPPIFNTIDAGTPTSQVNGLPATSENEFEISWSGSDEAGGSGIGSYDIFVSTNGGPFELFLKGTTEDSTTFTGVSGNRYEFFSIATDLVGHREAAPAVADAQTMASGDHPADLDGDGDVLPADVDTLCLAIRENDNDVRFDLNGDGNIDLGDHRFMIQSLIGTTFGDANLDGRFNPTDLILIFQSGQFEDGIPGNSGWSDGDWNCDADFGTSDLIAAFVAGGYSSAATFDSHELQRSSMAAAVDLAEQNDFVEKSPANDRLIESQDKQQVALRYAAHDLVFKEQSFERFGPIAQPEEDTWFFRDLG